MNPIVSILVASALVPGPVAADQSTLDRQPLLNRHWTAETVLADRVVYPIPAGIRVELEFRGEVGGSVALTGVLICNRMMGTGTVRGNTITMGPIGVTRMACDPDDPRVSMGALAALEGTSTYWFDDGRLTIAKPTGPGLILRATP